MSMHELVSAGAPELPEGWFYRVRETSIRALKVEIREQTRFRSRLVQYAYVLHENHDTAEAAIVAACVHAYEKWQREHADRDAFLATTAYLGDHDPKGGR